MVSIRKNFLKIKFKNTDQKDQMAEILLLIHILAGIIALTSAALTVSSEKGKNCMRFQVEHISGVWSQSS